jgi:ankyrin repeat protein
MVPPPLIPAPAPIPASPGAIDEVVVTSSRLARRDVSGPLAAAAARSGATPVAAVLTDPGARLRAAAAAGRTPEIERLLAAGAPIDAADAEGNTALMISIQVGRPEAAALLRRHGASLDQKNRAGLSARNMAISKADPALLQAVGLEP